MVDEIEIYLKHIKDICAEITEDELNQFSKGLTFSKLNKNDFYITAGQTKKQGGFLTKGLMRAHHTDEFGNEKNIYFIPKNENSFHYSTFMDKVKQ